MTVSLPTDKDGFLAQECPSCRQQFKVVFGEGSDKPISHCPYCGHGGHNCWWTQQQVDYMAAVATSVVLGPELKKLDQSLKNLGGGILKVSVKSTTPNVPPAPLDIDGDFDTVQFPCCKETIKASRHATLHCVICGKASNMNNAKKVFLSHKGIDKKLVNDFKETLTLLGYEPWIDDDAMPAGTPLEKGILKGMQDSCGVVFFITPSFKDEGFLETEIQYAIQEKRKKTDKFAIITLQFVGPDGLVGDIPELLKSYVWKKPETKLHALREIIRALPLDPGQVDWRDSIEGVLKAPTVKHKTTELSEEAKSILLNAAAGGGIVMHARFIGGESIQAGSKSLIPNEDRRTIALWVGGLEDLVRRGYIKDKGYKGEVFDVTREGYEAADQLKASGEKKDAG